MDAYQNHWKAVGRVFGGFIDVYIGDDASNVVDFSFRNTTTNKIYNDYQVVTSSMVQICSS